MPPKPPSSPKPQSLSCRPFSRDEWQVLRDLRLTALKTAANMYTSTLADEKDKEETWWRDMAQSEKCVMFGVFIDNTPVGCIGISTFAKDPSGQTAVLWGTFIQPDWRGKGLTTPLYKTALAYAVRRPDWSRVVVSHRESNTASRQATLAHGFKQTHTVQKKWPDGKREPQVFYGLLLQAARK